MNWGLFVGGVALVVLPLVAVIGGAARGAFSGTTRNSSEGTIRTDPPAGWVGALTSIVTLLSLAAGVATTVSAVVDTWVQDPADCVAYVKALQDLVVAAADSGAIDPEALGRMYGERLRDSCGSPADFVTAVGSAFVPTTTTPD